MKRLVHFIFENSLFLFLGAVAGLVWANLAPDSYHWLTEFSLSLPAWRSLPTNPAESGLTVHYLVNDILMAFFFALAGKEIWVSLLPGGALGDRRTAAVPLLCAVGGMAAPALLYISGAALLGQAGELARGWAIPCATDIAFSYMVALMVFGRHHSATSFLLLLAIADDALGLIVIAVFYPQNPVQPAWLALAAGAVVLGLILRRTGLKSFWWYLLLPGPLSWAGFALAGLHPALSLLPIIPTLPHARTGERELRWEPSERRDALDHFEAWWRRPVEVVLGLFGLFNAGVALTAVGGVTLVVLGALLVGKPLGIFVTGWLAVKVGRLRLPAGLSWRQLVVLGCAAGIGFTVALFVTTVAFVPGPVQDAAKMGALLSGLAAVVTLVVAKFLGVRR